MRFVVMFCLIFTYNISDVHKQQNNLPAAKAAVAAQAVALSGLMSSLELVVGGAPAASTSAALRSIRWRCSSRETCDQNFTTIISPLEHWSVKAQTPPFFRIRF